MSVPLNGPGTDWVPPSCTLPTARQAVRVAEFDTLFADSVRAIERTGPDRLRLHLDPGPAVAGRAAELAARETGCCSFFAFTLAVSADAVLLDVGVPTPHADLLDALAARAGAARSEGAEGATSTVGTTSAADPADPAGAAGAAP